MIDGDLIKQRRTELNISQAELAARCGYTDKSAIAHLEKGDIEDVPLSKAIQIAKALKMSPTRLIKANLKGRKE